MFGALVQMSGAVGQMSGVHLDDLFSIHYFPSPFSNA